MEARTTLPNNLHGPFDALISAYADVFGYDDAAPPAASPGLPWPAWLSQHVPTFRPAAFAPHHIDTWEWFGALQPGMPSRSKALILARGGGKTTTCELGTSYATTTGRRTFVLYVRGTQAKANESVQSIATILEGMGVAREVSQHNQQRGWKQSLLRAQQGFYVAAQGLDAAARGAKIDFFRPDLIIFDDVDARHDTPDTVAKKIETITQSILPAMAPHGTAAFVQNLIHVDSIAAQLADGRADFLLDRYPVAVIPAAHNLSYAMVPTDDGTQRVKVLGGDPTWPDGQGLAVIEHQMNQWGPSAFLRESQHEVADGDDGLWDKAQDLDPYRVHSAPPLIETIVALDPSVGDGGGDACGIQVQGIDTQRVHAYHLSDETVNAAPAIWVDRTVAAMRRYGATTVIAERNQGGEMIRALFAPHGVRVVLVHASKGKQARAEPIQDKARRGYIHHVGMFPALEKELTRWKPGDPSPNRMDAYVWGMTYLLGMLPPAAPVSGPPRPQYQALKVRR